MKSTWIFRRLRRTASVTTIFCVAGLPMAAPATTVILNPVADTFIVSSAPDNNVGGDTGFTAGLDGAAGVRRGLFRFDVSSIPPGSTVTSAVLTLTVIKVPGAGGVSSTFDLARLLADWGEGNKISSFPNVGAAATAGEATWNSRLHGTAAWSFPGALADAEPPPSASTFVSGLGTYTWSSPAVVSNVQAWVDDPAQNRGWLLKSQNEATARTVREFGTRESASPAVLTVGYETAPASNTAPSVSITAPTNGATFLAPATVAIDASASDTDGTVTNVEFFAGTNSLGSDPTGPAYSVSADLFPGPHVLTAVATDDDGLSTTSLPVSITVSNVILANPIAERIPKGDVLVELRTVADGMASPLGMAAPNDGSGRMFVYDQDGRVWIVTAAGRSATPLLDVRSRLVTLGAYDERGLLGFALHPNFPAASLVYTYTSEPVAGTADFQNGLGAANNHHSVIAEWRIDTGNSNQVDVSTRREILRVDQPQGNHNGGAMQFGPGGYLYIAFGDGGASHDVGAGHVPGGNGQDVNNIWGALIRIDVDAKTSANGQYGVSTDNPFVGADGLDETYAYGFRNPFAFSFDRLTGDLYLGDVGQGKVEEIDVVTAGGNYGWNLREGAFWFDGAGNVVAAPVRPAPPGLIDPIAMYDRDDGQAVIGGYVYRGGALPALAGRYVFGDWGSFTRPSGRLYYLDETNGVKELLLGLDDRPMGLWLKGWGQGTDGELYVFGSKMLGPHGATGRMLKLVGASKRTDFATISLASTTQVTMAWAGGAGPFAAQRRQAMLDLLWHDAAMTTGATQSASAAPAQGFFRVNDTFRQEPVPLSAWLAGDFEVPAVATPASGRGLFLLDGNTLTFSLSYAGLSGAATAAHLHGPAGVGTNASALINLQPFNGGAFGTSGTLSGVLVLSDAQKAHLLGGQVYVNVHTPSNPGGEVRGQVVPVLHQVDLSGNNERPTPVVTSGRGMGTLLLVGNELGINLTYSGLSTSASAAHIHGPADADTHAGVLVNLADKADGGFGAKGSFSGTVMLNPSQLRATLRGETYINLHTPNHPGGEIRGQVYAKPSAVPLSVSLSGLAERPVPVTNSASGSGVFMLEGGLLTFNLQYASLSSPATGAHLHGPASISETAGILVDLAPFNGGTFGTNGTLSGSVLLTPQQRNHLLNGQVYVNVHTAANPAGAIRGQIAPVAMMSHLSGGNERPTAVATPGYGLGVMALSRSTLHFEVAYDDLTGTASGAHIHGPASLFGTAGVLVDLAPFNGGSFGASGALQGATVLAPDPLGFVLDGQTYINVHTPGNPAGEIRGQIQR